MTVKIIQKDDPRLRETAQEVPKKEIGTEKINKIIDNMKEALASQDDGVAIAAPQIGILLRIFVISGKVMNIIKADEETEYPDMVFINPSITNKSKEKALVEEGCLSVRWLYGKIKRSKKVEIRALDESGKLIKRGSSGLLAQIFQHEIEHLDGKLFIDEAVELYEYNPEQLKRDE